ALVGRDQLHTGAIGGVHHVDQWPAAARRRERDLSSRGRPGRGDVVLRMVRETAKVGAIDVHHVNLCLAVARRHEGDSCTVWREDRKIVVPDSLWWPVQR